MLRASISFFMLGIIAFILGANGVAGLSISIGKFLLLMFIGLAALSFLISIFYGRAAKNLLTISILAITVGSLIVGISSYAVETNGEKVEAAADKVADGVKSTARNLEEKTCELINGKMKCAVKKINNRRKNATDKMGSKIKETKNKVD